MWDDGCIRHYYVNELARLRNGELVIPIRWIEQEGGGMHAEVFRVTFGQDGPGVAHVEDKNVVLIAAVDLKENWLDLSDSLSVPNWSGSCYESPVSASN